jgi:hypothetical protein
VWIVGAAVIVGDDLLAGEPLGTGRDDRRDTVTMAFYLGGMFFVLAWFPFAVLLGAPAAVVFRRWIWLPRRASCSFATVERARR